MSNESSDSKIIWNICNDDIHNLNTDESVLKGKLFMKVVSYKDDSIKVLGIEPKKYEKSAMLEITQYSTDMMRDMINMLGGKKSSDGNIYYKIVL